jgi:hypothetical protein
MNQFNNQHVRGMLLKMEDDDDATAMDNDDSNYGQ